LGSFLQWSETCAWRIQAAIGNSNNRRKRLKNTNKQGCLLLFLGVSTDYEAMEYAGNGQNALSSQIRAKRIDSSTLYL